eukprot:31260-Pelagococcus_subviridis.AAC.34
MPRVDVDVDVDARGGVAVAVAVALVVGRPAVALSDLSRGEDAARARLRAARHRVRARELAEVVGAMDADAAERHGRRLHRGRHRGAARGDVARPSHADAAAAVGALAGVRSPSLAPGGVDDPGRRANAERRAAVRGREQRGEAAPGV